MFCYLTQYLIFWLIWIASTENSPNHSWEIKHGNIVHSNGIVFGPQHTSFSMKLFFNLS